LGVVSEEIGSAKENNGYQEGASFKSSTEGYTVTENMKRMKKMRAGKRSWQLVGEGGK